MAPPSVGVATPMKMVPSTRKIRNSGGTITKVVCCAMCDRKRKPVRRWTIQFTIATPNANMMLKNMLSTTKSAPCVVDPCIMYQPNTPLTTASTPSETRPRLPEGSRKPTASAGRPGVAFGKQQRDDEDVNGVEPRQHDAGNEGAFVHVADRLAELVGHHDQHQRWRDDLRQRAGRGDDAGRHAAVVAVAQHDRQRDQAHGNHRGRDHAGGGGEQRADENHRVGEAAADGAEQLPDGVEQVFGHAGSFEHQSHEGEERDRQQRVVAHHAVHALGQRLQEVRHEQAKLDAEECEEQADRAEREGRRIAEQQENHQGAEHNRRHVVDQESYH